MSRLRLFVVLAAAWAALLTPAAHAQDDFRTGTHVLRRLLHERKFKALDNWQSAVRNADSTVLLLLGNPLDRTGRFSWQVPEGLEKFLARGGAVLAATDHALFAAGEVEQVCGYTVRANRVHAWVPGIELTIDPKFLYRGREAGLRECIILDPVPGAEPSVFWENKGERNRVPLRVVTNRAASLELRRHGPRVQVLANFPPNCWYAVNQIHRSQEVPDAFAVSPELPRGRFLLMSDHSVFINEMLLQEDNGNLDFAYNTIEWLREGRRNRVLIIEDGEIQSHLDIPLQQDDQPLKKLQIVIADEVNKKLLEFQAEHQKTGHFNNLLVNGLNEVPGKKLFGSYSPENFYLLIVLFAALGLALFGFARLVRGSHGNELAPVFASFGGRHRPAVSPLSLRRRSALAGDDLREFAREAARDWFAAIPGCPPDGTAAKPPSIDSKGGWWWRWKMRRAVRELWGLASGAPAPRLTQADFRILLARLERLREALSAGELRITW